MQVSKTEPLSKLLKCGASVRECLAGSLLKKGYVSMSPIELSIEQKNVFQRIEQTNAHVFITGKAGTGKSVLLQYFRDHSKKRVAVVAPTGVAALTVRGQTIHSLFRFPPAFIEKESLSIDARTAAFLKHIDTVCLR